MTATYHSVQLLQLVALVTITLGAQPVRGDASEGESTSTGGCISGWRDMRKAYFERQSSADVENSIFDFYPSDAISYGVLVMFYDMGPPPNTSTSGRRECCQRGSKDCIIYFLFRWKFFRIIHPQLLYTALLHIDSTIVFTAFTNCAGHHHHSAPTKAQAQDIFCVKFLNRYCVYT